MYTNNSVDGLVQLTVVIPSYNAEAHLETCLSSFFSFNTNQKFEIIVVDDGSTDSTANITKKYTEKYPDIVRLLSKENGGHGSTINAAIKIAKGRYFKVIDADDWVVNFDLFLDSLVNIQADAVITGYQQIILGTNQYIDFSSVCKYNNEDISLNKLLQKYHKIGNCCTFHGITYKTDAYREHNIVLTENVYYDDQEYACLPFSYVSTVHILPYFLYQYTIGRESQSVSLENQVKYIQHMETLLKNFTNYRYSHTMGAPSAQYFLYNLKKFATSYFAASFIKDPDNKRGRNRAKSFYTWLTAAYPDLAKVTYNKYRLLLILNYVHFPVTLYTWLLVTPLRRPFKHVWTRTRHKNKHIL